jgi:hypothetical protein
MSDKQQISDWQEKVRQTYGDEGRMFEYLFHTMDNFYYRYLETSVSKDLKTSALGPHLWGAHSEEPSMVDALKITNPIAKKGIMELAKSVPKALAPKVTYSLTADVQKLTPENGRIILKSSIHWGHPEFKGTETMTEKQIVFEYSDLGQFRKELAQKLQEVSGIFL